MTAIRVMLVDDHKLVRAGLRALLESLEGVEVVAEAAHGRQALGLMATHHPNVVLMDIGMPEMNGLEATARIVKDFPNSRVIILSMHSSEEYVLKALRAGAEDAPVAASFGINHRALSYQLSGLCAAYAAVAGVFIALIATLAPSEIWTWIGVVFAVVIIGRLGNPVGALAGGILIGVCEAMTQAVANPAWAPLVSFSVLIALLLLFGL